jgi:uncharacterized protein
MTGFHIVAKGEIPEDLVLLSVLSNFSMEQNIILSCRVIPNKPESKITGKSENGTYKIEIKAPPIEGKANRELIRIIAKLLGLSKSQVIIIKGLNSKNKLIRIDSMEKAKILDILASRIS